MFYVSVSKDALQKAVDHANKSPDKEVLGILIGRVKDDTLIIEDAVSGEIETGPTHVTMPGQTIALIADDILKRKIRGNIVGWYHSHPGYGLFMSDLDISTQTSLQQFSPYVVALIVDPSTGEAGFFTIDPETECVMPIGEEFIYIFGAGEPPIPPPLPPEYPISAGVLSGEAVSSRPRNRRIIALLVTVSIILGIVVGIVMSKYLLIIG